MPTEPSIASVPPPALASTPLLAGWRRYPGIYAALWRTGLVREMGFQINFFLWLFVELLWFALQLGFNAVLYQHTDSIGDWTKWQVVMLIGTSHFIQQLFQAFFLTNCMQVADLVHSGKMDFMLLFPANTRFLVSLRHVDLGGFVSAASGLAVLVYAAIQLQLDVTFGQVLGFGMLCLAGVLIHYSLMFLMGTISFWTVRAQGLVMAYYNLFSITRIPDTAFRGSARAVFTLGLPLLVVASVPVKVLTGALSSPAEILVLLAMAAVSFLLSSLVWRVALRRYSSASS